MAKSISYLLYTVWGCIWAMLWMHYISFIFLTVVMLFDTLTWTAKSIRLWEFRSNRLTRWIISKILILVLVLLFAVASHNIYPTIKRDDSFVWLIIWMLSIAEIISSTQNIIMVRSWEHIEEWDAVSFVLSNINSVLRNRLEWIKKK